MIKVPAATMEEVPSKTVVASGVASGRDQLTSVGTVHTTVNVCTKEGAMMPPCKVVLNKNEVTKYVASHSRRCVEPPPKRPPFDLEESSLATMLEIGANITVVSQQEPMPQQSGLSTIEENSTMSKDCDDDAVEENSAKSKGCDDDKVPDRTITEIKTEILNLIQKCKIEHGLDNKSEQKKGAHHCELCDQSFTSAVILLTHQTFSHVDVKKYLCSVCNLKFKQWIVYKEHMRLHGIEEVNLPYL